MTVLANLENKATGTAVAEVDAIAAKVVPPEMETEWGGMGQMMLESFRHMPMALGHVSEADRRDVQGPLATTVWVYCASDDSERWVEFDVNGDLLGEGVRRLGSHCAHRGRKAPDDLPARTEGGYDGGKP